MRGEPTTVNATPDFSLAGRTALVTGSTRGIGAAMAAGLAAAGARVARHGMRGGEDGVHAADLADVHACAGLVRDVLAELGRVDILVLNAAADLRRPWNETTPDEIDRQFAVNFRSTLLLCQAFVPAMAERGWGRVVTIGSVQEARPNPDYLVYAACKAAQTSLARNLARQVGARGVTVNNLAPGAIATDRNAATLADPAYRARVEGLIPAGRIGEARDVVGACLLLASEAGAYINGASLFVDGGWSA